MRVFLLILFLISTISCSRKTSVYTVTDLDAYESEHTIWKNGRIKSLTATEGWLSVIGLNWLKQGENTIGSRDDMDIKLPKFATKVVGQFNVKADSVYFEVAGESYVTHEGDRFVNGVLNTDASKDYTKLAHKSLYFYVLKRGERFYVRIKNTLAAARYKLKEIPMYPINYDFIVEADVIEVPGDREIEIDHVTGWKNAYKIEAELSFNLDSKKCKLLAFDGGPDHYFVIMKDETTHDITYGGGRYIYVPRPLAGETKCVIDFNKAHNPACAFTDYANCPIPPRENHLDFKVLAGEKSVGMH